MQAVTLTGSTTYDPTLQELPTPTGVQTTPTNRLNNAATIVAEPTITTEGDDATASDKLGLPSPKMSPADLMLILESLRSKTEQTSLKTSKEDVQNIMELKKNEAAERLNKLDEQIESTEKSKKSGEIGKIFSWIAAAAMTVAGAVLLATGVGTAAGVALLAGGIAMLTVLALQESGGMEKMMDGLTKSIMSTFGMSEEDARIFATCVVGVAIAAVAVVGTIFGGPAVGITIGAQLATLLFTPENLQKMGVPEDKAGWVSLGVSLGLAVAGLAAGVGSAVRGAAQTGTTVAAKVADVSSRAIAKAIEKIPQFAGRGVELMTKIGAVMGYTAQAIGGAAAIGQGGATIANGIHTRDAKLAEASVKELEKELLKLQQMFQDEGDRIKELMQKIQEGVSIVVNVFKAEGELNTRAVEI